MLQRKLSLLLTISYYHMLVFGLMPTTLRISGNSKLSISKVSYVYLIYSLSITCFLLLQFPFMFPRNIFHGYIKNNIILQWNLILNAALRVIVIISCYGLVWLHRQRLIRLHLDFLLYWRKHWRILRRIAGDQALCKLQKQLANILVRQFYVNYAMLFCSAAIQYQLLAGRDKQQLLIKIFQMLMLTAIRLGFSALLLLLAHQFDSVQLALLAIRRRKGCRPLEDLRRVANIHSKWLQLAQSAFGIYDVAMATVFLSMFAVNVNILYHAVQYGNATIKSSTSGYLIGDALIVFNLWNSAMVMNQIEHTTNACNYAGQLLRQFNDFRRLSAKSQLELELFLNRIRNNQLVFRSCGCVVLNRAAFLGYMASVLNKVIILMQFDLKSNPKLTLISINNNKS